MAISSIALMPAFLGFSVFPGLSKFPVVPEFNAFPDFPEAPAVTVVSVASVFPAFLKGFHFGLCPKLKIIGYVV